MNNLLRSTARVLWNRPRARGLRRIFYSPRLWLGLFCFLTLGVLADEPSPTNASSRKRSPHSPQTLDPYQREEIKRKAAENTEHHRTRVTLPPDAAVAIATGTSATLARVQAGTSAPADSAPIATENLLHRFFGSLLLVLTGALVLRKFGSDIVDAINRLSFTGALSPSTAGSAGVLLAEERMILEFKAALQAGSQVSGESADSRLSEDKYFSSALKHICETRQLLADAGRSTKETVQRKFLLTAIEQIRLLLLLTAPSERLPVRQMASAVEMLLRQLSEKSSNVTSSTLRTATIGVTLLEELCQPGLNNNLLNDPPLRLLVADDEIFSRNALSFSLKRGLAEPEVAETGESALALAARSPYDLIFLDVMMPGMDGFELCSKIHNSPLNRTTPVVFVTGLRDFDTRAQSILCGGRDIIAKPFLTFELTVKALTLIARERLRGRARLADDAVKPLPAEAPVAQLPEVAPVPATKEPDGDPKFIPSILKAPAASGKHELSPLSATAFLLHTTEQIEASLELLKIIRNTPEPARQQEIVTDLTLRIHTLVLSSEKAGHRTLALISTALEGLLLKLLQNAANLTASALQTVDTAAVLIRDLSRGNAGSDLAFDPPVRTVVVDDDPVTLRAISIALQMRSPKPACAPDGKTALALAAEQQFDVIFLDLEMPDMNGLEVCSLIRQTPLNGQTPVVFVTNHDNPDMRAKSLACGGNDYIIKPFLGSELTLKCLAFALQGRLQSLRLAEAAEVKTMQTVAPRKGTRKISRRSLLKQKRQAARTALNSGAARRKASPDKSPL